MRNLLVLAFGIGILLGLAPRNAAFAQLAGTGDFHIQWEVKNRFRLFKNEADFQRIAAENRGDGILAQEERLENDTGGMGWARDVVGNLCLDAYGELIDTCERDGVRESYLSPKDHPVGVSVAGPLPQNATCMWSFDDGDGPVRQNTAPCNQEVRLRVKSGKTTVATVDIPLGDGTAQRVATEIAVRDVLIAGHRRFHRRRRGQSGCGGRTRRRLLLSAFLPRRRQPIFPAEPRRL